MRPYGRGLQAKPDAIHSGGMLRSAWREAKDNSGYVSSLFQARSMHPANSSRWDVPYCLSSSPGTPDVGCPVSHYELTRSKFRDSLAQTAAWYTVKHSLRTNP
jgi:hypothetical protein